MQFQVTIRTPKGGTMVCGVSASSEAAAYGVLSYLPGAGRMEIVSIEALPPRSQR